MEVLLIDAIIFAECSFRVIPKTFNIIDVILTASKFFGVTNFKIFKFACIQYVVTSVAININKAVRFNIMLDYRH